ncbi:TolC family outer membrane protein [Methyloprofundus sp.]|uniref:TolC family outer membrane protein n=1 Tax=Methyloprofundus sp. TaxID=2020875 RepID=UPI003D0C9632
MNKTGIAALLLFSSAVSAQNLLETYDLALQNDPILRRSLANKMAVDESKDQSIARLLPSVNAGIGTAYNWTYQDSFFNDKFPGQSRRNDFLDSAFGINLVQPIFHYDMWVQLSQSEKQIAQANASYLAEQQNLMLKTTNAYFSVLAAQDDLTFALAEQKTIARQLEQAQQRFEVGLIAITDVYEAQAGYDQSRSDVIAAENNVQNAKEALKEIIGPYSGKLSVLGETLPLPEPIPNDIDEWNNKALNQNLLILVARNESEIIQENIDIQRSGHYPTLDVVGSFGLNDTSGNLDARGNTESIGVQLNIPLFEGGAVNSRTREAEYQFTEAKENLIATQRAVTKEVKNSYRGVLSSISQVGALKSAVKSGKSSLEATEAGFDVGTRTMVDVLSTTRNYTDAQSKYSKSRYAYILNGVRLKNAASILNVTDLEAINRYLK